MKKNILLVGHDCELAGASHYIYNLYKLLKKKYKKMNIYLCLPYPMDKSKYRLNTKLTEKYDITQKEILEYDNNEDALYFLYNKYKPVVMYLNSYNEVYQKFYHKTKENNNSILLHSHEIYEDYITENNKLIPNFTVAQRISNQYSNYNNIHNISFQPPIMVNLENILKKSNENINNPITNSYGELDKTKVTIGMCGNMTGRKNQDLFFKLASHFPEINFLWVGGHKITKKINNLKNAFHMINVMNPYKYFYQIFDYFLLTSLHDPCPYVVLENLLLETKTITFEKNIYYKHHDKLIEDFYFEQEGEINLNKCIKLLREMELTKKDKELTKKGFEYIQNNFTKPNKIYKFINSKLM